MVKKLLAGLAMVAMLGSGCASPRYSIDSPWGELEPVYGINGKVYKVRAKNCMIKEVRDYNLDGFADVIDTKWQVHEKEDLLAKGTAMLEFCQDARDQSSRPN